MPPMREMVEAVWTAMEHSPVGVVVADPAGRVEHANPRFLVMSGRSLAEVREQTLEILALGTDDHAAYEAMWQTITRGDTWSGEIESRRASGERCWEHVTISPARDERGATLHYVALVEDVTHRHEADEELRRAKEQADAANRAKSAFLAAMSHEIRTPLNGILGMLEILAMGRLDGSQKAKLAVIRDSATSLLGVINDVLDISKIEADRLELDTHEIEVQSIVESAAQLFAATAGRRGLGLRCFVDAAIRGRVLGDGLRLRQVLDNLLSNAIKFTQAGEVTLVAELLDKSETERLIRIQVSDTGIGIAPENREKLFKPFSQAESSTTRRFGGSGLGLAISARIIGLMGGKIAIASTPGQGTTVTLEVPFRTPSPGGTETRDIPLRGAHVVLVSRDPLELRFVPGYLERWSARVSTVTPEEGARTLPPLPHGPNDPVVLCSEACTGLIPQIQARIPEAHVVVLRSSAGEATTDLVTGHMSAPNHPRARLVSTVAVAAGRVAPTPELTATLAFGYESDAEIGSAGLAPRRDVLVVEDHPVNQRVLLTQLEILGYQATLASNGQEALDLWRASRHAVIITDCHMPVMDGFELTERVRAEERPDETRTPIVALTATTLSAEEERGRAAGIDEFLTKPLEIRRLKERLETVFAERARSEHQRQSQELRANVSPPTARATETSSDVRAEILPVLDLGVLHGSFGDDPKLVREVLLDYVATNKSDIADLRARVDALDVRGVTSTAHRMKGAARLVGARALAELCHQLEARGRAELGDGFEAELERILTAVDSVEIRIRELTA